MTDIKPVTPKRAVYGEREPIAIIGMGCRFPGARDVDAFWRVLAEGRETIGEYPGGRFAYIDQVYAVGSPYADRIATRRGGFLPELDRFDAEFFGISPREAALLDPQQRLLLEVAWEAIDDAGLVRERIAGTRMGVFVGVWTSDYEDCLYEFSPDVDFYATTGSGRYGVSGRLAYVLDVRGPNLTVDTACSSSLVAIHLACQSLLTGESQVAVAGGVNAILRPEITLAYSGAGMLALDARCKFGDASADGYVRSEGAGVVVLKRLSQAVAEGDAIYAVIRGSAVNNDGRSSGLLVSPSARGQEDVIVTALESAGVSADAVDYLEAHGTGTSVGDPIEIETIGRVMASAGRQRPCAIGSVKTNIGHTESAAGAAGVIKVALAMDRGILPASLHLQTPNPRISWSELPVVIPSQAAAWPRGEQRPVAGVSGFGITGTNAHVVLEGYRAPTTHSEHINEKPVAATGERPLVFLLSGHTPDALRDVARSWSQRLAEDPAWPASLKDLAYTAAVRRTQHACRLMIAASSREELQQRLIDWVNGEEQAGVVVGDRLPVTPEKAVFVYPGQGGQWVGMGRALFEREPVFREALLRCDAAIARVVGWSVVDELRADGETSRLDEIDVVQPTLFAVMIALTELWRAWGVEPAAVVGHSMGEVAAAVVAGALSLDDGAAVICHRSRLMKQVRGQGLMAVVELSLADTQAALAGVDRVWIGASNGATSTVISGDADAVDAVLVALEGREVFCRRIRVDVASHSGHMDAIRAELEAAVAHVRPRRGTLPMYSTTTGDVEDGSRLDAAYWGMNLRQPVLFYPAVERLLADGFDAFVEINAHPVLTHSLMDSVRQSERAAVVTGSLRRDGDDQVEMLAALGTLHAAGYQVQFERMYPSGTCLRLPTYAWQRERHWFEFAEQAAPVRHGADVHGGVDVAREVTSWEPAECLYEMAWVEAPADAVYAADVTQVRASGHWIVLADDQTGNYLAEGLAALGDTCTVVRAQDMLGNTTVNTDVDENADKAWERLPELLGDRAGACRGVVHLWTVADRSDKTAEVHLDTFWQAQRRGSYSVPGIVRALEHLQTSQPQQLWLVTAGVQQIVDGDTSSGFAQGPLWGLGRVVAREHPELQCANLDLSADVSRDEMGRLARLLKQGTVEEQLALRGNRLYAARYRRYDDAVTPGTADTLAFRADATYLVTGGLSGIGLLTARWLVDHGARQIVLTARRAPSDETLGHIADMEARGTTVRVVTADVSDAEQVNALLQSIADLPPLKGIFHLAVATDDALLTDTKPRHFEHLMAGKAAGAWNLYQATRRLDLDVCVLFSSIATLIAQPGQGAYAAANAFLDALARYCRQHGYPARSIEWGPWIGGGLSTQAGKQRSVRAYADEGVQPMQPELGFSILERALAVAPSSAVVMAAAVDWAQYATYWGEGQVSRTVAELVPVLREGRVDASPMNQTGAFMASRMSMKSPTSTSKETKADVGLRDALLTAEPGRARRAVLEEFLRTGLARVLKIDPTRIDVQKPVGAMGVDSLMAMEFVRRISAAAELRLPATVVFNYPTLRVLTTEIARRMEISLDETSGAAGTGTTSATPEVGMDSATQKPATLVADDLSEEEALRSLMSQPGHRT